MERTFSRPWHAVDGLFHRARDRDHHLIDRHHAVIDADHDAGKIRGRKNRDGNIEGLIAADQRDHNNEENYRRGVLREPMEARRRGLNVGMVRDLGFIRHLDLILCAAVVLAVGFRLRGFLAARIRLRFTVVRRWLVFARFSLIRLGRIAAFA